MYHSAIPGPDESVRYLAVGETQWVYRGGSRSWRTHNPGELRHSLLAVQHGAIGQADGVAVFPTRAAGRRALDAQLASRDFAYLSLEQVCRRFDPDYQPLARRARPPTHRGPAPARHRRAVTARDRPGSRRPGGRGPGGRDAESRRHPGPG